MRKQSKRSTHRVELKQSLKIRISSSTIPLETRIGKEERLFWRPTLTTRCTFQLLITDSLKLDNFAQRPMNSKANNRAKWDKGKLSTKYNTIRWPKWWLRTKRSHRWCRAQCRLSSNQIAQPLSSPIWCPGSSSTILLVTSPRWVTPTKAHL